MQQQAQGIAGIFTQTLGEKIGEAIQNHDWAPVQEELANMLVQLFQQVFAGMGPFGGFLGGILGGLLGGLGGLFGGGSKSNRGESMSNPIFTYDVRAEALLTAMLNATKAQRLQTAAAANNPAGEFQAQLDLVGGGQE